MSRTRKSLLLALALAGGCTGQPAKLAEKPIVEKTVEAPAKDPETKPAAPKEPPPPSAPAKPFSSPKTTWAELGNGLSLASRTSRGLPLVRLRLAVAAGSAVDGEKTGLASVCANAMATSAARALSEIGLDLRVDVNADRVTYGVTTTRADFEAAVGVLATVVTKPSLGQKDVEVAGRNLAERALDRPKSDGLFNALAVLHQDLFTLPSEHHPYASHAATAEEIGKITAKDCSAYQRRYFVPKNTLLAASGEITPEELRKTAEKSLGSQRGSAPAAPSFTDPMPPESTKITLVDQPGKSRSDIVVGALAPKQDEQGFAAFLVAAQVLAGPVHGRLAATKTTYDVLPFAFGPSILYTHTTTSPESTGAALKAVLDATTRLASETPAEDEIEIAKTSLAGARAVASSRPDADVDELCDLFIQKRPDDARAELARATRDSTAIAMTKIFAEHVREEHLIIVVTGDAAALGPLLQPFGEVKVVDPSRHYARIRTLPRTSPP